MKIGDFEIGLVELVVVMVGAVFITALVSIAVGSIWGNCG